MIKIRSSKKLAVLTAVFLGLTVTACSTPGETADSTARGSEEAGEASGPGTGSDAGEELPASAEYTSADGTYKVTLLEGLEQTDMQLQSNSSMMGLDGGSERTGFSGISLGSPKGSVPGNPASMESLEEYADHVANLALEGSGVTVDWQDGETETPEWALRCLVREGVAKSGGTRGQAYAYYIETDDSYYSVILVGRNEDVEEARKVLVLEVMEGIQRSQGSQAFISGMTAVLNTLNGASVVETVRAMEEMGADESQMENIRSQAAQALSGSWGVEDAAGLMEQADWLINEGHNQNALEFLGEYGGTEVADRAALEAGLEGEEAETRNSVLAAYDAWTAYGEAAISAWDLSRVGSILGYGYAAGYCTYGEAMDKSLEAAQKAQASFASWDDFNQSYLYGYAYWSGESLEDPDSSAAERAGIVETLKNQANGPFSGDWNVELKKEWWGADL